MTSVVEVTEAVPSVRESVAAVVRHAGVVAAIVLACGLSLAKGVEVPLRAPIVLAIAGLAGCFRTTNRTLGLLQMIVCLYLGLVPLNQLLGKYVEIFAWGRQVRS